MKKALVGIVLIIGLGLVATLMLDGLARVKNAAAMESAARAVQIQATAGAVNTIGLTVVIVLLAALVVGLLAVVVVMGRNLGQHAKTLTPNGAQAAPPPSQRGRGVESGKWLPGPNANWGRAARREITEQELARALAIARAMDGQVGPSMYLPSGEVEDPEAWEGLFGL